MLIILRAIVVIFSAICISLLGMLYSLIRFRNPNNVHVVSGWLGSLNHFFGLTVECRFDAEKVKALGSCIYIANHQNNYDLVTMGKMVMPRTVTVGKKSLLYVPFFGLLYWLTGNILLDRENKAKAHQTMVELGVNIKENNTSIWMFPEGTRSRGRGLLPFKMGAFHLAIAAGVPIVPICCSNVHNKINLNRLHNGLVISEMLDPIETANLDRTELRRVAKECRKLMENKIAELNEEVARREAEGDF